MLKCKKQVAAQSKVEEKKPKIAEQYTAEKTRLTVLDEIVEESKEDCIVEEYSIPEAKLELEPFEDNRLEENRREI